MHKDKIQRSTRVGVADVAYDGSHTRMLWRSSQGGGTFRYVATGNGGTRRERAAIRAGAQSARMQARIDRHPAWVRYTEVGE